jgi:chromosome segregation ATPase
MDAISLFDRQCNELRYSLVQILSDDGHLAELKNNLNKQRVYIDEERRKISFEKAALDNFCEEVIRDKAIIKSEMEENRRILIELRQAQAVSRERILKSQGILQDFCAFSTDIITVELKEAEKTAVESVEICKSISAAVKLFNGDKKEAEQSLNAVQEELRTKRGEQTELDQRLTLLREEAAAAELRLQTLRRDEEAVNGRVEAANGRIATLQADEEARNIRIAAQNATLDMNSSTINNQKRELDELKERIMKHNVHLRNIQKYKEEYPKMVARMRELDTKEAELAAREQALLRRSSGSALATPLGSVTFSQLGSIHSVAGASGTAGAAAGGSPEESLELGAGVAEKPGSLH